MAWRDYCNYPALVLSVLKTDCSTKVIKKDKLKIVGWTMSHPKENVAEESAAIIVNLNGDITLLTHGWRVRGEKSIQDWLGDHGS